MAKSLRSKWKKKMRAVKRVRYGKKELEKLKLIVGTGSKTDVDMENISEIATVTDAEAIKEKIESEEVEAMEVGGRKFNKKTFRDQNGSFPVWMSQKQVKKKAKSIQQKKKKKSKNKKK